MIRFLLAWTAGVLVFWIGDAWLGVEPTIKEILLVTLVCGTALSITQPFDR